MLDETPEALPAIDHPDDEVNELASDEEIEALISGIETELLPVVEEEVDLNGTD